MWDKNPQESTFFKGAVIECSDINKNTPYLTKMKYQRNFVIVVFGI